MDDYLHLGQLLGRRQAFSLVAGRCTAAEAAALLQMRDGRLWESHAPSWKTFCGLHLHLSCSQVNRIIQALQEFGPAYFDLAQLTRISPETYRAIAPAIREDALHTEGEPIALVQENAARLAAAVATLRKAAPRTRGESRVPSTPAERLDALSLLCDEVAAEFAALARLPSLRHPLSALLCRHQTALDRVERELD